MNNLHSNPKIKSKSFSLMKITFTIISLIISVSLIITIMVIILYPKLPDLTILKNYQPKLPLKIYSADGVLLGQFGDEHRVFVSINKAPKLLIKAILAAEDERFYEHGSIDYLGVLRALILNIISGRKQSGASTITMQVARNFFLTSKKTYYRKFNEVLLAYKMENTLTKNQILELYINQIYLGQKSYGFGEAALTYFGKSLDMLNLNEFATLAALPKAPSSYNPVVNKVKSHNRMMYVLYRMKVNNFITNNQYNQAINNHFSVIKEKNNIYLLASQYIAEMTRQMMYNKFGENVYTDGYQVYTTIDSKMQIAAYDSLRRGLIKYDVSKGYRGAEQQLKIEDDSLDSYSDADFSSLFDQLYDYGDLMAAIVIKVSDHNLEVRLKSGKIIEFNANDIKFIKKYLHSGGNKQIIIGSVIRVTEISDDKWKIVQIPQIEGSIIALDPNNGSIKALVGGFDYLKNKFNHVIQSKRQPGSGFKPFIYSAALEKGFNANSMVDDKKECYFQFQSLSNLQWCPKNDNDEQLGLISLREALAKSINTVTIKVLDKITTQFVIDYLSKFGFSSDQFKNYLTLGLGVFEVTPFQMAKAYAVFANGGYLVQPYLIDKIVNNNQNVLAKTQVINLVNSSPTIDVRNTFVITNILQDAVRYGTGANAYKVLAREDMAGKTGTTSDAKDVWFNGYTPDLVAITWVGYDIPKSLGKRAYGANIALPIWVDFMKIALSNIPEKKIPIPVGLDIIPNSTWKNNNEYIYNNTIPNLNNNDVQSASSTLNINNIDDNKKIDNDTLENFIKKLNDDSKDNTSNENTNTNDQSGSSTILDKLKGLISKF